MGREDSYPFLRWEPVLAETRPASGSFFRRRPVGERVKKAPLAGRFSLLRLLRLLRKAFGEVGAFDVLFDEVQRFLVVAGQRGDHEHVALGGDPGLAGHALLGEVEGVLAVFSTGGFSALNWVANMPAMVLASEPLLGPTTMVTETPLVALAKMALVMP